MLKNPVKLSKGELHEAIHYNPRRSYDPPISKTLMHIPMFKSLCKFLCNIIDDIIFFFFVILSEYEETKDDDSDLSDNKTPPLEKKDCGWWLHTVPGHPPEQVDIRWDDRNGGFTYIYIDGYRQLPVRDALYGSWKKIESKNHEL